jgi:hypothetical protein
MSTTRRVLTAVLAIILGMLLISAGPAYGAPGGKPASARTAPVSDSQAPDRGVSARAVPAGAAAALEAIQRRIADYVARHGTAHSFASFVDVNTGRIVLETDAPGSLVSSLIALPGAATAEAEAAGRVQVRRVTTSDTFHRRDDIEPFWGGAGITDRSGVCSSGYAVRNSAGTIRMTTAGHCFANGATVWTESLARVYGTVSGRRLDSITGDGKDMELIGGKSYAGRIYTGSVTSSSSIPVVSAGSATVGYNDYCHSGRTTGENCGHTATSITAQVCTGTGCKSPVIRFTGGTLSRPGDSGSPFYAKNSSGAFIRGHVIAGSDSAAFAETYTKVASTYSVSIVTG